MNFLIHPYTLTLLIGERMVSRTELQEELAKLKRRQRDSERPERAVVTATGTVPPAWAIKVLSLDSYNVYDVQLVDIKLPGVPPSPVTGSLKAYNLAESFTSNGSLSAGTYAVMWRVGKNYVFNVGP